MSLDLTLTNHIDFEGMYLVNVLSYAVNMESYLESPDVSLDSTLSDLDWSNHISKACIS